MARWNMWILVALAVAIGGMVAYGLSDDRINPFVESKPFTVTRQQAVLSVLESAARAGIIALPVGAEKYPHGLQGDPVPAWVVAVDIFHSPLGPEGPWERRGCVVDGRTAEVKSCSGGKLPWIPND